MLQNARPLRPEFVPSELQHRDHEQTAVTEALDPLTRGEPADPVILTGPTGVGKTCLTRYALKQLQETALTLDTAEVNCWENYSGYRFLYRLLDSVGSTVDIHRQSTPRDELMERLRDYSGRCVVALDEVDQLEDKDLLYDLHRMRQFSLVLIANREEDLFADLGDRLHSRLHGSRTIRFKPYSDSELVAILKARADAAFTKPSAIDETYLEQIADAAAGDARIAITILREAAKNATAEDRHVIDHQDIERAIPRGQETVRATNVETLKPAQQTLYELVREYVEDHGEPMPPQELYDQYGEAVEEPVGNRQVRRHMNKLERYELISVHGSTRDRKYGLHNP